MAKRGPKCVELDWQKLDLALSLGASMQIAADYCNLSTDTISRRIKAKHGITADEYRDRLCANIKLKLIQKAHQLATQDSPNVTMLIFCLKNLCGWSDKIEHGFDKDKKTILLKYNLEQDQTEPLDVTPAIKNVDSKD
jgi:hypothetical protein